MKNNKSSYEVLKKSKKVTYKNLKKLSDSYLIYYILNSDDSEMITRAISLIKSQRMLYLLIIKTKKEEIKQKALSYITDEKILVDLAIYEESITVAIKALYLLKQFKWIQIIPYYGMSDYERIIAIEYIDDEKELKNIAEYEHQYEVVRVAARNKIAKMNKSKKDVCFV